MDFAEFQGKIQALCGLNLAGYKEKQLKRRIDSLMQSRGYDSYLPYLTALRKDPGEWQLFMDKITINVSEFFRNPEIFARLETEILPFLLQGGKSLKIWSAACSNGAEPYSLAILLKELTPARTHQILATDIDSRILAAAREGVYPEALVKNISDARLKRYFQKTEQGYQLSPSVKSLVNFKQHDLLTGAFGRDYDLIVCRNVTIYFTPQTQLELYQKFYQALAAGGVLFIGATESILRYRELGYKKISPWFYQKA